MARVIGYVKSVENGMFYVKNSQGQVRVIKAGEAVHEGEYVYGANNNSSNAKIIIDVTMDGAHEFVLAGNQALHFDTTLLANAIAHDEAILDIASVSEVLNIIKELQALEDNMPESGTETAAGENVVTDTERMSDAFATPDGIITDVTTNLNSYKPANSQTLIELNNNQYLIQTDTQASPLTPEPIPPYNPFRM